MRPVRSIATLLFAAAVAVTGCTAHRTAVHPSATPTTLVTAPPFPSPTPKHPDGAPQPPSPAPGGPIDRTLAPRPVLADGRYDALIRQVDTRHDRAVVDLVQVFYGHAAEEAAIADGKNPGTAKGATFWISNHNPRLRTLPLARDLRLDLRDGEFEGSRTHELSKLSADAFNTWFTLTVSGGVVQQIQEH